MALKHRHSVEIVTPYIEAFAPGRCTGYLGDMNLTWHSGYKYIMNEYVMNDAWPLRRLSFGENVGINSQDSLTICD